MNWDVGRHTMTDEDIREMPETLRERIAMYQEQRREGQKIMHQLANPPEDVTTAEVSVVPATRLFQHLTVISFQLLLIIILLGAVAIELK